MVTSIISHKGQEKQESGDNAVGFGLEGESVNMSLLDTKNFDTISSKNLENNYANDKASI